MRRALTVALGLAFAVSAAAEGWPGAPPDCWPAPRMVHAVQDLGDLWKKHTTITTRPGGRPAAGETSPNRGYRFTVEEAPPDARVTIYAEKDHLVELRFADLHGLSEARWVSEKLIFLRAWWGRLAATDLIFDVEQEKVIYAETVTDGTLAHRQYLESCPLLGCACIKKKE